MTICNIVHDFVLGNSVYERQREGGQKRNFTWLGVLYLLCSCFGVGLGVLSRLQAGVTSKLSFLFSLRRAPPVWPCRYHLPVFSFSPPTLNYWPLCQTLGQHCPAQALTHRWLSTVSIVPGVVLRSSGMSQGLGSGPIIEVSLCLSEC